MIGENLKDHMAWLKDIVGAPMTDDVFNLASQLFDQRQMYAKLKEIFEAFITTRNLMFVWAKIDGKDVTTLVETGATNNIIALHTIEKLGLKFNATAQSVKGMAQMTLKIGNWEA
ncbi:Aspartic peptidase domain superfamily [Forsythia ovata]|uniref:Aspartic peptidase domain superfamily n=1 Tax=Forsythia ovata TaxID=205694 RepID=A0ABD1T729_9LAMI